MSAVINRMHPTTMTATAVRPAISGEIRDPSGKVVILSSIYNS